MNRHKHADVIHAYAEGAKIEWRMDDEDRWRDCQSPGFVEYYQYRVKPEEDPYKELKEAYAKGEKIECYYIECKWRHVENPAWDAPPTCYRIAPKPSKQPYSMESWRGEWVRCVYGGKTSLCRVLRIDEIGISVATIGNVSWDSLLKMDYEWSNSLDGPWHPCYR
jgi:hypothetical protein